MVGAGDTLGVLGFEFECISRYSLGGFSVSGFRVYADPSIIIPYPQP